MHTVTKAAIIWIVAMCGPAAALRAAPLMQDIRLETGVEQGAQEQRGEVSEETQALLRIPNLEKVVDPDEYVLGPYDYLIINLIGTESRSFFVAVLPEGDVLIPGVGAIGADGLTISEFRQQLASTFDRYFRNVEIFCYLKTPRKFRVFVTGEVERAGAVEVFAVERISDAIERAGSIKGHGSTRFVQLTRGADTLLFDILRFYLDGDFSENPFVSNGDRIHVPPSRWHAVVTGGMKRPGSYEIRPGETLADLIALAGGFASTAVADSIVLTRVVGPSDFATMTVTAADYGMELADLDEISVINRLAASRRVIITGAAKRTGLFHLGSGEGLADLLVRSGGLDDHAALDSIVVERKDGSRLWVRARDLLSPNPGTDFELRDGDIVQIPPITASISVGGEVQTPGEFPFRSDWTIAQYVGLAGGPTKEGSIDRVVLVSPDGSTRSVKKYDVPERGDIIIVKRARSRILGEFFSGVIRLATAVISIIVLTQ